MGMRYILLRMSGSRIECVVIPESQVKHVKKLMKNRRKLAYFAELANWKPTTVLPNAKTVAECSLNDEYYVLVREE
jgi:hypothetical protein